MDILITVVAVVAAFALRLEGDLVTDYIQPLYWMILISLLIKPVIYYFFGLYRRLWAYASINELTLISTAVTRCLGSFLGRHADTLRSIPGY